MRMPTRLSAMIGYSKDVLGSVTVKTKPFTKHIEINRDKATRRRNADNPNNRIIFAELPTRTPKIRYG